MSARYFKFDVLQWKRPNGFSILPMKIAKSHHTNVQLICMCTFKTLLFNFIPHRTTGICMRPQSRKITTHIHDVQVACVTRVAFYVFLRAQIQHGIAFEQCRLRQLTHGIHISCRTVPLHKICSRSAEKASKLLYCVPPRLSRQVHSS